MREKLAVRPAKIITLAAVFPRASVAVTAAPPAAQRVPFACGTFYGVGLRLRDEVQTGLGKTHILEARPGKRA